MASNNDLPTFIIVGASPHAVRANTDEICLRPFINVVAGKRLQVRASRNQSHSKTRSAQNAASAARHIASSKPKASGAGTQFSGNSQQSAQQAQQPHVDSSESELRARAIKEIFVDLGGVIPGDFTLRSHRQKFKFHPSLSLGSGGFGEAFKGTHFPEGVAAHDAARQRGAAPPRAPNVAVKQFYWLQRDDEESSEERLRAINELIQEVKANALLVGHINDDPYVEIVRCLAVVWGLVDGNYAPKYMVMELMFANLRELLVTELVSPPDTSLVPGLPAVL